MRINNIYNDNSVKWRVFEKETLQRYGTINNINICEINELPDGVNLWRLTSEYIEEHILEKSLRMCNLNNFNINDPSGYLNIYDKAYCYNTWKANGIKTVDFYEYDEYMGDDCLFEFPVLVRLNNDSGGRGTFYVNNASQFKQCIQEIKRIPLGFRSKILVVNFLETKDHNGIRSSFRIIVSGEKIITGYPRIGWNDWNITTASFNGDFRDNFKHFIKYGIICESIIHEKSDLILKAVKSTKCNHVGVDLILHEGELVFIEIQPGYSTGYEGYGEPFYNPSDLGMVKVLIDNINLLGELMPTYVEYWLDKRKLFNCAYKNLLCSALIHQKK